MNILFISHGLYPCKIGGVEIFNYHLIKALIKFCKIFVITCCKKEINLDFVPIRINPRKFRFARISIPIQDFINIAKLRNEIDLVHLSYIRANWIQWLLYPIIKKVFAIPYIVSIHGGGMHKWKPRFPHELLFNNASAIIGVSKGIKEEYEKRTGRKVKLIPPLIPFIKCKEEKGKLREKYNLDQADTIILCLGSIKKNKGNDTLLDAFIKLGKRYVNHHKLKLLFVGDGEMRKDLKEQTKRENFNKYVRFFGNIPHKEVPALFKIADIYVIPSLFEATPISMLEAMFNEMPIIGTDTNGINDKITDTEDGLLFEAGNSEDLKKKIMYLVENENIKRKISHNARMNYEKNYNFDVMVKEYIEVFERTKRTFL